ncbi:MAG: hypothetical protein [Caudoviricetes sp.]|nr:MAG: hypothetical protein [Caudoviricetes sp.]
MAKLYFHYGAMSCGKSSSLLQVKHNYEERGMKVILWAPSIDDRAGAGIVKSRIGLESKALIFNDRTNFFVDMVGIRKSRYSCVIIDEAQFLTKSHVLQLARIVDEFEIPVMCYGLRTDFRGELFEGSKALMQYADDIIEHKTICFCGSKATMTVRYIDGKATRVGEQVLIGDQEYQPMCRKHYMEAVNKQYEA